MKRASLLLILTASCCAALLPLHADEETRQVQEELKSQGFFFGETDGQASPALTAAVKRFQIRNGLSGSGKLDGDTLQALGLGEAPAPAAENPPPLADVPAPAGNEPAMQQPEANPATPAEPDATEPPAAPDTARGPVNLRRGEAEADGDQRYLPPGEGNRGPGGLRPPSSVRPPAHLGPAIDAPANIGPQGAVSDPRLSQAFAGTPYSTAPASVQRETVKRAQQLLSQRRIYRAGVDGIPGPAMEEALLLYQRALRLPETGQLNLETLSALRLLPGRGPGTPALKPFGQPGPRRSTGTGFVR